jgi:hypothetical protein
MRLLKLINIVFIWCLTFSFVYGQTEDTSHYKVKHFYQKEYSPYFKFNTFKRGELKYKLSNRLDSLTSKSKRTWTYRDSFNFAQTNLLLGNHELASHYLNHLEFSSVKNPEYTYHYLISFYVMGDYNEGLKTIYKTYPRIVKYSKIYFIKQIYEAKIKLEEDKFWYKKDGDVFKFTFGPSLKNAKKNSDKYKNELLIPLKRATYILELFVYYIYEDDPAIACAFNNVGEVVEEYISLSQAYIAYSIARNYNKKDKRIIENIKRVKAKLTQKHYRIPNFRTYFPKIEKGRFDYEILKEKIFEEQLDTIPKLKPKLIKPKEVLVDLPFNPNLLYPIGLFIIFIMLLLFLRTRKK